MTPVPRHDPLLAKRKIYFCKALNTTNPNVASALDRAALVASIQGLVGSAAFYLVDGDPGEEQSLCAVVDRAESPHRVRFYRVRRRNLPETEGGGVFRALELGEQDGLAESIHMVFFDDDVVGAEYNHYGPRATTFGGFVQERCSQDVRLRYLIRSDVIEKILRMPEIRKVRIKVEPSVATALKQHAGGLGGAFDAAEVFQAGRYMELVLAARAADRSFTDNVKSLLRAIRGQNAVGHVDAFEVYGKNQDSEYEHLNLLHDRVIVQTEISRESPRSRALDKDSAYAAVEAAYASLGDAINAGGTITVD
jgi:hypothetical protein